MLGDVTHQRNDDDAEEELGQPQLLRDRLDCADQRFADDGGADGSDDQHNHRELKRPASSMNGRGFAYHASFALWSFGEGVIFYLVMVRRRFIAAGKRIQHAQSVKHDHDQRHTLAEQQFRRGVFDQQAVKQRRDRQRHHRQQRERRVQARSTPVKSLNAVAKSAEQQAESQHQQQVADDRPGDGRTHKVE